jgi:nitroreductase
MNDVITAIQTRRTIRRFKETPVPEKTLDRILEAGRWAQSFNNAQPWEFIVIRSKDTRRQLSEEAGKSVYYKGILEAPLTIAVCVDSQRDPVHWIETGCIAHQNMALAAHSLGLGSSWIAAVNTRSETSIKKLLHVPKHVRVISLMPVGFPDEEPEGRRRPLGEMVHHERYGEKP